MNHHIALAVTFVLAASALPTPNVQPTHAVVPDASCRRQPVCYDGSLENVLKLLKSDPLVCPSVNATRYIKGACFDFGYGLHLGVDPVFRYVDIYMKRPNIAPSDSIERCESRSKTYNLKAKGLKALVITTSHGVLGDENCTSCKATGVASPEFTIPYYIFADAGVKVTLASIQGGRIPIDTEARYMTHWDTRFWNDKAAIALTFDSPAVASLNFTEYDLVYMAGGWGAAWDLGVSIPLAEGITMANTAGKVLGSVCHGALGFIQAKTAMGTPDSKDLVFGRNMSAVSNRQIEQLGIASITPLHPETELKKHGANYFANHGLLTDIDQSDVVVDGRLVTGQNQNSACETAQRMLDQLE